jgi:energy-coupling factor transporter ATP-binding protein EcfA2
VRILSLRIHGVRRHRDVDLALAPGFTVVRGPNESGKSTVQRAIELALYRKATSAASDLDAVRTWGMPADDAPAVTMTFEDDEELEDGTIHVRSGSLTKTFRGAKGTVRLELDGDGTTDPALADEQLAEMTGVSGESFYAATASIHHRAIDIPRDDDALRDRLQSSISGGDRGASQAKKKLGSAIRSLTSQGTRNPGRLKVADDAVRGAEAGVRAGEDGLLRLEADRDTLGLAREKRGQAETTLVERRALLEKARLADQLRAQRDVAQERYARYRRAAEVSTEIDGMEASHPSATPVASLEQIVARLRALDTRARELRAILGETTDVDYDVTGGSRRPWLPLAAGAAVAAIAGIAGLVTGLAAGLVPVAVVGGVLVVVGAFLGILAERQRSMSGAAIRARELQEGEIDRRLRGRSELEAELRQCEADIEAQTALIGMPDLAAAETLLVAEREHVATMGRLRGELTGLVGREPAETIAPSRDAAALEVEQRSAALDALGPIAKEPRARERLEVEVRDVEAALERARDDEAAARARLDANTVDAEQVAAAAERLAAWLEELEILRRRERVYGLALAAIERAETATMKRATRFLESRMRADLPRLTDGRYRRVTIDDATLDIRVHAPELDADVPVSALSQATFDQVHLAARLGLVRFVLRGRRPPILLDDPFVTFDDARASAAVGTIRDLARDFQVILFTTSDRFDGLADAVIELAGPTARDAQQPGEDPLQKPPQQPAQQPGEEPPQKPPQQPAQKPGEEPAQKPPQQPGEDPPQKPQQQPAQKPAQPRVPWRRRR